MKCTALFMGLVMIATIGCVSELITSLNVAQSATKAAGKILTPVNAEYGAALSKIGNEFGALGGFVGDFDKSVAAGKPAIAQEIKNATDTLTQDLSGILAMAQIKNPEKIEYVTIFVAIGAEAVDQVIAHLPQAGVTAQAATVSTMAKLPHLKDLPGAPAFKDHNSLKKVWNDAVAKEFPKAKI